MFKRYFLLLSAAACSSVFAQQNTEDIIPREAVTVFTLNNIQILQKVSMDELVSYEFMTELQSELFDGSTTGKTLKESGIDFNQKMNIFYGKNDQFEISGFTFGISDRNKLFTVFDDFDQMESIVQGTEYYNNYFNHLMIRGNLAILIRVDSDQEYLTELADSIWTARGFELPWANPYNDYYDDGNYNDYEGEDDVNVNEDEEFEEITDEPMTDEGSEEDIFKNYFEMRDSLENELAEQHLFDVMYDLFVTGNNLKDTDPRLAEQLTHESDAVFFLDNSRNLKAASSLWYFQTMFPELYNDLNELYKGNVMLGDVFLKDQTVEIVLNANYGEALGKIYSQLNNSKFDKNVLRYIPNGNSGFFTYNIDLKKGYETAYDIIIPILREERNPRVSANVLMMELINEFVNTDEVFRTYKGSMFGTFNGIKRVKTTKIEFSYDEQTFEYQEREVESEEDMPVFTLGFSTARGDIPEKVLNHLARLTSQFQNMGDYWIYKDAILNSVPLYMINKNGLFIFTNDEDLAVNHSDGYGKDAISAKTAKHAKKSGSIYGYLNLEALINELPRDMFTDERFELIESLRGKTGEIIVTSSKTTTEKTTYNINYEFIGNENAGKYLLDLLNTAYIITKQ
jgi:hypothetical protein